MARGITAFAVLTIRASFTRTHDPTHRLTPLVAAEIHRAGHRLLPITALVALGLGFILIGQAIQLFLRLGIQAYLGTVLVTAVVRELGPLFVALLVLARVGATQVVELATRRADGALDALEATGTDPIRQLVVPRVLGLSAAVLALSVYFIFLALAGGWLYAFLQNLPLTSAEYLRQLVDALGWQDFVALGLKASAFGTTIAAITCYHGMARDLQRADIPAAASHTVVHCVAACFAIDVAFAILRFVL